MKYDVIAIGNAVMDMIAPVEDSFLTEMGIQKGIMQLIEMERSDMLFSAMGTHRRVPGGGLIQKNQLRIGRQHHGGVRQPRPEDGLYRQGLR